MRIKSLLLIVFALLWTVAVPAQELRVAAASDLRYAMQDIAKHFETETGSKLSISFGSSGNFYNQIQNGGPYDIYFSADIEYPRNLEAAGLIVPGSLYEYATGKLVLWVPENSPLDLKKGIDILLDSRVKKIAIANPAHAPYGRAAIAAMQSAKVYDRIEGKLVRGDNISQTAQFVQTGGADVGFVALSLALSPTMKSTGRFVEVPATTYPSIKQAAVILKTSKQQGVAQRFLEYFRNPESAEILRQYGFVVPSTK